MNVATSVYRSGGEDTIWWRVSLWGDRFDKKLSYLKKGSAVVVCGEISRKPEMYTDKNGAQQVSSLDIRAESIDFSPFGGKSDQDGSQGQASHSASQQAGQPQSAPQFGTAEPAPAAQNEEQVPF